MVRDRTTLVNEEDTESESEGSPTDGASTNSTPSNGTSSESDNSQAESETVNIKDDWDANTFYVEPALTDDLDDMYRRLQREMKREENVIMEKHRHFFKAVLETALNEHQEETRKKAQELARQTDE